MLAINKNDDTEQGYRHMLAAIGSLLTGETDLIACLSNITAIINCYIDRINWVGFYLLKNGELVLGPFQGLPACIRIKSGQGVCGTASSEKKTVIVTDVHNFEGHIACDANSKSEIVIPLFKNGEVFGVLDLDSPEYNRFGAPEEKCLKEIASMIGECLDAGHFTK